MCIMSNILLPKESAIIICACVNYISTMTGRELAQINSLQPVVNWQNRFKSFRSAQNTKERLWWEHLLTCISLFSFSPDRRKDNSILNESEDAWKCLRQGCLKGSSSLKDFLQIWFEKAVKKSIHTVIKKYSPTAALTLPYKLAINCHFAKRGKNPQHTRGETRGMVYLRKTSLNSQFSCATLHYVHIYMDLCI